MDHLIAVIIQRIVYTVIALYPVIGFSQHTYVPFKDDSLLTADLLERASLRFEKDKKELSGPYKKYLAKEYQDRFNHIKEMHEKKQFVTDARANVYLEELVGVILKTNPSLKELKPTVLFSREYWPNAASFGEGTIVFNISLFNRLRNESQAAFIICHELAHFYLQHSNKAIDRYVNTLYSKEFQEQLRDIKKSEYQKGKSLDKLVKNISYKSRRHSRGHELEADSMALELLRYTGYDVRESLTCLALLDSVDTEKYNGCLHLSEQLNFEDYPFRKSWLRQGSPTLDEAIRASETAKEVADTETDSLKTHPDCSVRILRLMPEVEKYYTSSQQLFKVSKPMFDTLVRCFDYELPEYCYQSGETGRALYYALQRFYKERDNLYLATLIGKCFYRIYQAQKAHTFSKVVDSYSAFGNEEYETFLKFLSNLKLADIASLGYRFMEQYANAFGSDKEFDKIYRENKTIFSSVNN